MLNRLIYIEIDKKKSKCSLNISPAKTTGLHENKIKVAKPVGQ